MGYLAHEKMSPLRPHSTTVPLTLWWSWEVSCSEIELTSPPPPPAPAGGRLGVAGGGERGAAGGVRRHARRRQQTLEETTAGGLLRACGGRSGGRVRCGRGGDVSEEMSLKNYVFCPHTVLNLIE